MEVGADGVPLGVIPCVKAWWGELLCLLGKLRL